MTYNEFQKRDMELQSQIADYRRQSCDAQAAIAMNEKEIINLELARTNLRAAYSKTAMEE